MMTCSICGNDTSNVDFDYLIGDDHLACHLGVWAGHKAMKQKPKKMKIKGWDKINGFTYKGYCIVNPAYGVGSTGKYYADILDLNTPNKTKWELSLLTPDHKFVGGNEFIVILWDNNKLQTRLALQKEMISDLSKFRHVFERLIENMLHLRLQHGVKTFSSHSLQTQPIQPVSGIVNQVNNSGTTIKWQSIQSQAINAMQDLQKQIDLLNSINNVKDRKLQ